MHLYVGNLAPTVTEGDLRLIFDGVGEIVFMRPGPHRAGDDSRGYAYVSVANGTQARIAVSALHGRYLKGTALAVELVADRARVAAGSHVAAPRPTPALPVSRRNRRAALGLHLVKRKAR